MRRLLTLLFISISLAGMAQNETPVYDSVLAKSLGADEYGMKSYTLAILKTGPYNTDSKTERDSLFRGHMDNIKRMADAGQLVIAGPFGKNDKQFRGLFILNTTSVEDARSWLKNDAAINAGIFEVEYIPWYGSAAISTYLPFHERITKSKF
ncbi:MAG TPA: YciI family protein [Lentimicrobium sp.]|nr:YciI family protein [Lentimicrobium sp.]